MIKSVWSHIPFKLQWWQNVNLLLWNKLVKVTGRTDIYICWKAIPQFWQMLTAYVDGCTAMAEVWALLSAALFPVFVTCSGKKKKKKNIEKCKYKLWNLSGRIFWKCNNKITLEAIWCFLLLFLFFNCWLWWKCSASSGKWKPWMMLLNAAFILNLINHSNSPKTLNHSLTFYAVYIFLVKYILANANIDSVILFFATKIGSNFKTFWWRKACW